MTSRGDVTSRAGGEGGLEELTRAPAGASRELLRAVETAAEDGEKCDALVLSLASLLAVTVDEAAELLDELGQQALDSQDAVGEEGSPERIRDGFERGLQLGLLVGLGYGVEGSPLQSGTEASAPNGR